MQIVLSRQVTVTWDGRHYPYEPHTTYDLPKETVSRLRAIDLDALVGIDIVAPAPVIDTEAAESPTVEAARDKSITDAETETGAVTEDTESESEKPSAPITESPKVKLRRARKKKSTTKKK